MKPNGKNAPIIVGLLIPVCMVMALAAYIYLPRLSAAPEYDFVYALGNYPAYNDKTTQERVYYDVEGGYLTSSRQPLSDDYRFYQDQVTVFYLYKIDEEKNVMLSEDEASNILLNPDKESPDGFTIDYANRADNIFEGIFGGSKDYDQPIIKNGSATKALKLKSRGNVYGGNVNFVGWVNK